jgi:hypothetical protein
MVLYPPLGRDMILDSQQILNQRTDPACADAGSSRSSERVRIMYCVSDAFEYVSYVKR